LGQSEFTSLLRSSFTTGSSKESKLFPAFYILVGLSPDHVDYSWLAQLSLKINQVLPKFSILVSYLVTEFIAVHPDPAPIVFDMLFPTVCSPSSRKIVMVQLIQRSFK